MDWYALHVASLTERIVSRRLGDAGIESYYPWTMRPSKEKYRPEKEQRLFPGYVFAKFAICERTPVVSITQVLSILGTTNIPAVIPEHEIAAVRLLTHHSATVRLATCPYLSAGESVVIQSGPLQGLQGIVVRVKGKSRLVVSISMLKQSICAELDAADCVAAVGC